MVILEHTIPEDKAYDVIVALEMVKSGYIDRKSVKLPDGWKLSISRFIENSNDFRDYLQTGLAVRMANYIEGIKDTAIFLYPDIEQWIREGQEIIKYDDIVTRSGNLMLIKSLGEYYISDGIKDYKISESYRKKIAYAMRYRWYYKAGNFFITDKLITFNKIPIKEPPKFYLLLEL